MIIEGVTWSFHLVMMITIVVWLSTLCLYFIFLMGWHFSYKSIMWPGVDLWFNILSLMALIIAAALESAHVWRWNYRNGLPLQSQLPAYAMNSNRNSLYGSGIGNIGLSGGLGSRHFCGGGGYSVSNQRDCMEMLQAMAGINLYYGHHIFSTIFLWVCVILYVVSTFIAWRLYREFEKRYFNDTNGSHAPGMSAYLDDLTCGNCCDIFDVFGDMKETMSQALSDIKRTRGSNSSKRGLKHAVDSRADIDFNDDDSFKHSFRSRSASRDSRNKHGRFPRSQSADRYRRDQYAPQQGQLHRTGSRPSMMV